MIQMLSAALQFKATGADGKMFHSDIDFHKELDEKGRKEVLQRVCEFTDAENDILHEIKNKQLCKPRPDNKSPWNMASVQRP